MQEIYINLKQLLNSIYEYKKYLKFEFVVQDVKRIYGEKEQHKTAYEQMKKDIDAKEQQIIKLDEKNNGKGLFKKSSEKVGLQQDAIILEVKSMYRELDKNKVAYKIATELNDDSTISDALYLASSFYNYLYDCISHLEKEMQEDEIETVINELKEFVRWPYATIINNIGMLEEKDLLRMIKDRYQLLGINLTKEDLDVDNLDIVMRIIEKIEISYNINKQKIDAEDLGYIYEFKKILNK